MDIRLIKENPIVKIVAPTGFGKTTLLPKTFGEYGYKVVVVVSHPIDLKFENVTYVLAQDYFKNKYSPDILFIDELDNGNLDNFLIISDWKKRGKSKLVLLSMLPHSLFPDFPTYLVKSEQVVEVRYSPVRNQEDLIFQLHNSSIEGNFLVFTLFPDEMIEKLKKLNVINEDGERKVIVVDDSGKTALKETDFGCIFDNMKEIRKEPTLTGGVRERERFISKRDARLRAGRSSRNEVIVYRLMNKEKFDELPEVTDEELFRIPLHHLMIDLYERKLNPFEVLPPLSFNEEDIEFVYNLFLKFGVMSISGKLTNRAKLIRNMDFGIRPSLLCLELDDYSGLVLASCIDNYMGTPFLFSMHVDVNKDEFEYEIDMAKHIREYYNRFRGESDCETFLYMYTASLRDDLEKWSNDNTISYQYMKNVYDSVLKNNLKWKVQDINIEELIKRANDIFEKLYSDRKMKLDLDRELFTQYKDSWKTPYSIDSNSINLVEEKRPLEVFGIITSKTGDFNSISVSYVSPFSFSKTHFQNIEDE